LTQAEREEHCHVAVRLAAVLALLSLVAASAAGLTGARPSSTADVSAVKCKRGFVSAFIAGKHTCLRAGQRCNKRYDRQYHKYGFHCHGGKLTKKTTPKPPPPPPPIGTITARVSLASAATGVAAGEGAVWVREGATIQRVDPATNAVTATIAVGNGEALAAGEGAVWASNFDANTVSRIDVQTNAVVATIPTRGTTPGLGATGFGSAWVGIDNPEGEPCALERIDPVTNSVVASISDPPMDVGCGGVGVGAGSVWAGGLPTAVRIDPAANRIVARISGPAQAVCGGDLVATDDAVWCASGNEPRFGTDLVRIDPARNALAATIPVRGAPTSGVAVGFGAVWVTTAQRPGGAAEPLVVARIDPGTSKITGSLALSDAGEVAIGFDSVWVAAGTTLLRITPAG
jgi:YVTN family beta-propeller protein